MPDTSTLTVARSYIEAMNDKDFATECSLFADDIVWHQPGGNQFSGTRRSVAAVNDMIGARKALTQGALDIQVTGQSIVNGAVRPSRPLQRQT